MKYVPTIGLEVHVQLKTESKMFCSCSTVYGAAPNTQVCPVCLGYPGTLPLMNGEALRLTAIAGLMLGCRIAPRSKFDRKSYFYPDMPKNYQISQYDMPVCTGGGVRIQVGDREKLIRLTRIHLEEDVGKSMHSGRKSTVDFNRAGVPLMEIVSEPDIDSPEEAFLYLLALKRILLYAGVSDCNLEQGNMRCDVNCSLRPQGTEKLGTKTEIKNLNTFKGVLNALKYEVARQADVLGSGGIIRQETRRWDTEAMVTESMRSKEDAHDYRYFPEPDLMPVTFSDECIAGLERSLPERPDDRKKRFISQYGIPSYDAGVLVADKLLADYFEKTAGLSGNFKAVSNWMMTEMLRLLSENEKEITDVPVTPAALAGLIAMVDAGKLNSNTAKDVFAELFMKGGDPARIVEEKGLAQLSDISEIEAMVAKAVDDNPKSVADFRNGKEAAAKYLIGQVMKMSRGKANPRVVSEILMRILGG